MQHYSHIIRYYKHLWKQTYSKGWIMTEDIYYQRMCEYRAATYRHNYEMNLLFTSKD